MEYEERVACANWAKSAMAEMFGPAPEERLGLSRKDTVVPWYPGRQWCSMVQIELSGVFGQRVAELIFTYRDTWDVWPLLSVAELGAIMQAGAAEHFPAPIEK